MTFSLAFERVRRKLLHFNISFLLVSSKSTNVKVRNGEKSSRVKCRNGCRINADFGCGFDGFVLTNNDSY